MRNSASTLFVACLAASLLSMGAQAQEEGAAASEGSRLLSGPYIAPMASYILTDDDAFDDGYGGTLAAGYRRDWWAVEAAGLLDSYGGSGDGKSSDVVGGTINGLVFPFKGLPNFFGLIGVGGLDIDRHPVAGREFSLTTAEAGAGYIFPLSVGNYDFGIRADARYRYGKREKKVDPGGDIDVATEFKDVLFNLGFQFPLGMRPAAPAPVVEAVAVVAPVAICADGQDNDGDGQTDFPNDPGCSAADDGDETDPAQCSDGKDNDGDSLIDFPSDKGCSAADDTDEVDPCKTPEPGEVLSLKGCGTGDIIVLRGVNFEFDKSRLTANARTILDSVASELTAYPDIKVELSGHTDAKGSDAYNQRLSEQRAASVVRYLKGKGVASDRMSSVGYGESKSVADNETDEGRELNRRVELKVTEGAAAVAPAAASVSAADATAADPAATDGATPDAAPAADAAAPEPSTAP